MTDILVVGSINTDLVIHAPHFPAPGETIQGSELSTHAGGKGANQAVAAARQDSRVAMIGRVGMDRYGDDLIDNLTKNGVDATLVKRDETATGTAMVIVDDRGQNSIVVSPGANNKLVPEDVEIASLIDLRLVLFQLEIPLETAIRAAQVGRSHKTFVLLNPAPARELPDELLQNCDYLLPNESELSLLSGLPVDDDLSSVEKAARKLLNRGVKNVIATLGAEGSMVVNEQGSKHLPAYKVKVVDTTGAGDSFIGGFASALLRGEDLEQAARYGNACGALAATRHGAQPSIPHHDEVVQFLKSQEKG